MIGDKEIPVKIWELPNGNVGFRFNERDTTGRLLTSWRGERLFDNTVHELMDDVVARHAKAVGRGVIKTKVHCDTKGTYGLVSGRFFLALIDDGNVWEYPIISHETTDETPGFFECERVYSVSESSSHIRAIESLRWNFITRGLVFSDQTEMSLLLMGILLFDGGICLLIYWLFRSIPWSTIFILVGYFILFCITEWTVSDAAGKFWVILRKVVSAPMFIIYFVVGMMQPFIAIVGTYLLVSMFAFGFLYLILVGLNSICGLGLSSATRAFLVMSVGSILCSHSYATTKWVIHRSPLRNWGNHAFESYREELAEYVMHPSNVIAVLYFLYFVFLIVSGYMQIQSNSYLVNKEFDAAVLKAFLVFIAFTNMRIKAKDAELDVKELWRKTLLLFSLDKEGGKSDHVV